MIYFDKKNNRLVVEGSSPTPDFWDNQWNTNDIRKDIESGEHELLVSRVTEKFIKSSKEKKILEGGCGKGHFVFSLKHHGYDAYGIDYAEETIRRINNAMPDLNVSAGDVRHIKFSDSFFDGYWSLGVIEHFFNGYDDITKEMQRVIKRGGFLFVTFPYLSMLRRLKIKLGFYPNFDIHSFDLNSFYYFALDPEKVQNDMEKLGFSLVYKKPLEGLKGLKDEAAFLRKPLQRLYDSNLFVSKVLKFVLANVLAPFSAHVILLVFKKNEQ